MTGKTLTGFACSIPLTLALSGCLGDPALDFRVCGDAEVPGDVDALRISVLDPDMHEIHAAVLELVDADSGDVLDSIPLTTSIPSGTGLGWARVEALLEGVKVITFARRVADLDTQGSVDMPINLSCLGMSCPLGQTCVEESGEGKCKIAPNASDPPGC